MELYQLQVFDLSITIFTPIGALKSAYNTLSYNCIYRPMQEPIGFYEQGINILNLEDGQISWLDFNDKPIPTLRVLKEIYDNYALYDEDIDEDEDEAPADNTGFFHYSYYMNPIGVTDDNKFIDYSLKDKFKRITWDTKEFGTIAQTKAPHLLLSKTLLSKHYSDKKYSRNQRSVFFSLILHRNLQAGDIRELNNLVKAHSSYEGHCERNRCGMTHPANWQIEAVNQINWACFNHVEVHPREDGKEEESSYLLALSPSHYLQFHFSANIRNSRDQKEYVQLIEHVLHSIQLTGTYFDQPTINKDDMKSINTLSDHAFNLAVEAKPKYAIAHLIDSVTAEMMELD
jgi:hypothetical protein